MGKRIRHPKKKEIEEKKLMQEKQQQQEKEQEQPKHFVLDVHDSVIDGSSGFTIGH